MADDWTPAKKAAIKAMGLQIVLAALETLLKDSSSRLSGGMLILSIIQLLKEAREFSSVHPLGYDAVPMLVALKMILEGRMGPTAHNMLS